MTTQPELPNIIGIIAEFFHGKPLGHFLEQWENIIFSFLVIAIISIVSCLVCRKLELIPRGRLQSVIEVLFGGLNEFVCGILGKKGQKYTPFIGTLFIYILFMNLLGLIPFFKAPTSSWSTTLALALCVFIYVQWTAFKELGFLGYLDHLAGKPRGVLAFTVIMPLFMLFLHIITELIRPLSLSLRLRGNIWGDEVLIGLLSGFGIKGLPLLFFNMSMTVLTALVQAVVFCLLATIYFALVLTHEEEVV